MFQKASIDSMDTFVKLEVMRNIHYNLFLLPEPEGGFTVIVPALPGCVTYGKNLIEAKKMATDAIKGYVASLRKHKESIPPFYFL